MNYVLGCSHGCLYPCYAYLLKKRFKIVETYNEWINPIIVDNTLDLLETELPKLKRKIKSIHLCFSTDPFMYGYEDIQALSLKVIERINAEGIKCTVLTKGLLPMELTNYSKDNEYGITLISLDEDYRKKVEPGAAPYNERIQALKRLHDQNLQTWVSIEPYPTPNLIEQNIVELLDAVSFTNKIIFGRTNYNKDVSLYKDAVTFYNKQVKIVREFCYENGIKCIIKKGTEKE